MRYYSEWLDGEYVLLDKAIRGYSHRAVMERSIRLHAIFGSTIVLSDTQLIDFRNPIPSLFVDRDFKRFIRDHPAFLALVASPVAGERDLAFGIAMRGVERTVNQADKPKGSFEMALTDLGEPLLRAGRFQMKHLLSHLTRESGQIGRCFRRYPLYKRDLLGILYAVNHFASATTKDTTQPSHGPQERYDELLQRVGAHSDLSGDKHRRGRIERILQVQSGLKPEQWGRRAAIRKLLGTGAWHNEDWSPENLRLYLDVTHAWNCAVNRSIAPEAGSLFESGDDLPLSRFEQSVCDRVDWFPCLDPSTWGGLSRALKRFLCWDPLTTDWATIAVIADATKPTALALQRTLREGTPDDRAAALVEHASYVADHVTSVPGVEVPQWTWNVSRALAEVLRIPSELVDAAEVAFSQGPHFRAQFQRKLVVNSIATTGTELLNLAR